MLTREAMRNAIGETKHVAILDAPNQRNVGDTLIWLGELAYLDSLGYDIAHVSDLRGYDADVVRKDLPAGGVILLHGGGNFGDLWVGHQKLRERIADELPDYRIVQLPQSIFFADETRAKLANDRLRRHPDFTLMLRDSLSAERATRQLPDVKVVMSPDMAFGYEPPAMSALGDDILVIARADHESASGLNALDRAAIEGHSVVVTDWWKDREEPAAWRRSRRVAYASQILVRVRRKLRLKSGLRVWFPLVPRGMTRRSIYAINQVNIDYALDLYSRARVLIVDRLHAHVLGLLLGIDHVVLDNNYRKIGGVFDDYSGRFSTARYSLTVDDAVDEIRGILA
ncbi:MAG: epsO [Microbacterium sp.]|nr:epsO [Microbacterium sp.]